MNARLATTLLLAAAAWPVMAQTQQVRPPIAVYWLSAETNAGMGMSVPAGIGAFLPPGMAGGKRLRLALGSSQTASGEPRAAHAIPPAMAMGASLPLLTPVAQKGPTGGTDDEPPFERPKGRMLIYWGCGEAVRAGQPVIVDFSKLDAQEAGRVFRSRAISRPTGPASGRNRTYGEWPNRESQQAVPAQSSLQGGHTVSGNYSPEIRFNVTDRHDFLAPLAFDPVTKSAAGAFQVKWQSVPNALGYFATAMGQGENQTDVVMWSSSDSQEFGQVLMDYIPPAEVQRLIREKVVMPSSTTSCSVPAGIFKSDGAMLNMIAYGDELNVVHPPRPADPKQTWEQEYAVKLRIKSTGGTLLAEGERAAPRGRAAQSAPDTATGKAEPQQPAQAPNTMDAVKDGVNLLRGLFGR